MEYLALLNLGIGFLQQYLASTKSKLPGEIVASIQSTIAALEAHKDDVVTKENLESQRG